MKTSGPNNPGTLANDASFGTTAWSNPSNAASSNNADASAAPSTGTTQYLKATNFGFNLPKNAKVLGITVGVERSDPSSLSEDERVRLVKGGSVQTTDKASAAAWPTSDAYATYGSNSDLWGSTWTAKDINDSTFGMVISAQGLHPLSDPNIDHIRITVAYEIIAVGNIF